MTKVTGRTICGRKGSAITPERIAELRKSADYGDDIDRQVELCECLDEIEGLQRIVDGFPKTEDGMLITLGMTVWIVTNKIARSHVVGLIELSEDGWWISWGWNRRGVSSDECYSTQKAAEEAIVVEVAEQRHRQYVKWNARLRMRTG